MIEFPLTKGQVALVDDEDFDRVSQHKWIAIRGRCTWYGQTNIKRPDGSWTTRSLHRLVLDLPLGRYPEVDHIDGNGTDCRKENMRLLTRAQNAQNQHAAHRNSQTGVRGVFPNKRSGTYRAEVRVNSQHIYLGSFKTLAAAEQAAIAGRRKYMTHAPECERAS